MAIPQKTLDLDACHEDPMVQELMTALHDIDEKAQVARRFCALKTMPLIVMHSVNMSEYASVALSQ